MSTLRKFTAINDKIIEVDVSEKACLEFGFMPGQKVVKQGLFGESKATVVGVAPLPEDKRCASADTKVLWISSDGDNGKICFTPFPGEFVPIQ